ncbi:MAG TPA: sulfotransferase [Rhizomicrobium sp.]|nr:sulfotransferase [Rhizomicrobium sp.]
MKPSKRARDGENAPEDGGSDPFEAARYKLLPPRHNRKLEAAAAALAAGGVDIAQPVLERHLEKHPDDPVALNLMADIARRAGEFEEADRLLLRCVEKDPDCPGYRFHRAIIASTLQKYEEALAALDILLLRDAQNPLFRDWKAKILSHLERFPEAVALRRELTEEFPQIATVWIAYGNLLRHLDKPEEAISAYRSANMLGGDSVNAYMRLADMKTYRFSGEDTARMGQLMSPGLSGEDRVNLCFALGAALGDQKRYAESFENFAKANAFLRADSDFDADGLTAHRTNCERLCTGEFFRQRNGSGVQTDAPVFIVGMPRSGSTLVEQILSSHSAIEGFGELAVLDHTASAHLGSLEGGQPHEYSMGAHFEFHRNFVRAFSRAMSKWTADDFHRIGEDYVAATGNLGRSTRRIFTDKGLPNFGYLPLIHLILPNAKIIDVRRHPLDCGWSCFKSRFPEGLPFANRLADIGKHYANYVRLMAHFDRVLPGRVHRVIYEDLIADPEREVRRMLDHLGLPFEEGCMRFHENKRAVNTLSSTQVRLPLYNTGVAQWQPYEPWLGPLKAALGDVLELYPDVPAETH